VGWVLDRTRFDAHLAAEAGSEGAEIWVGSEVTGLNRNGDGWHASITTPRGEEMVEARLVVGADGVESMVGRWAGIDTRVRSRDMESCAQYVVHEIEFDPDAIYLHFGDAVAPGGYAWVFPRGVGVANVGLGVVALKAGQRSAREWLDQYMADRFPDGIVTGYTVGGVISAPTLRTTFTDGVLIAGDAAHMINPLSGGGIINAMKAGRLAAEVATKALASGDVSAGALETYHKRWMRLLGDDHVRYNRIKEALEELPDSFYNELAVTLNDIPTRKRTLGRIFAKALVRHPALLPVVARFFI
jgi:digeranylgeranylglycerophospholipid reductase